MTDLKPVTMLLGRQHSALAFEVVFENWSK